MICKYCNKKVSMVCSCVGARLHRKREESRLLKIREKQKSRELKGGKK